MNDFDWGFGGSFDFGSGGTGGTVTGGVGSPGHCPSGTCGNQIQAEVPWLILAIAVFILLWRR